MGELKIIDNGLIPRPEKEVRYKVVEMDNKPLLAVALENPKLRDFSELERNTITGNILVPYLLDLLGVNGEEKVGHWNAMAKLINEGYLAYTYQEIKYAFELYVKGELNQDGKPMTVYQQLNSVVFGRVMREYTFMKRAQLDSYWSKANKLPEPEMSQEEKDANVYHGTVTCFDFFIQERRIDWGYVWVYDYLINERKLHEFDPKDKEEDWKNSKEYVKSRAENTIDKNYRRDLLKSLEEKEGEVISVYKRQLLKRYFEHLEKEQKHIKDIL
ncbi:MAG: hypothetical protein NXH86_04155 [Flavobacteriaceae bacterium]|nr:hypothetical protein [Flavobacteriaceae bacterium]